MNIPSEIKPPLKETIIKPLICKVSDTDYVSDAQCLVNIFFAEDFSPCPHKCTTIHMKGFHYVNKSSNVGKCDNFEDEICNGGPKYGTRLLNEFRKCLKPCKMITYKGRLISESVRSSIRLTKGPSTNLVTLIFPPLKLWLYLRDAKD